MIDITRLKPGIQLIVETPGNLWSMEVVDPEQGVLRVYGTDPKFKDNPPANGQLVQAYEPKELLPTDACESKPFALVKDWLFQIRFANVVLVGGPVSSVLVEGDGWHYDAIS